MDVVCPPQEPHSRTWCGSFFVCVCVVCAHRPLRGFTRVFDISQQRKKRSNTHTVKPQYPLWLRSVGYRLLFYRNDWCPLSTAISYYTMKYMRRSTFLSSIICCADVVATCHLRVGKLSTVIQQQWHLSYSATTIHLPSARSNIDIDKTKSSG